MNLDITTLQVRVRALEAVRETDREEIRKLVLKIQALEESTDMLIGCVLRLNKALTHLNKEAEDEPMRVILRPGRN